MFYCPQILGAVYILLSSDISDEAVLTGHIYIQREKSK